MIAIEDCDRVGGYKRKLLLINDHDWGVVAEEPCRVVQFNPSWYIKDGKFLQNKTSKPYAPYATVLLETLMSSDTIKGYITNKTDFTNLWKVFRERTVTENEEVIIVWTTDHYKQKWLKSFSIFLPKLRVLVCRKGHLEFVADPEGFMADPNWQSKSGERPSYEEMGKPIVDLKPNTME